MGSIARRFSGLIACSLIAAGCTGSDQASPTSTTLPSRPTSTTVGPANTTTSVTSGTAPVEPGRMVLTGGTIVTMDGDDAEAMVVSSGHIEALGTEAEMLEAAGDGAVVVDLEGRVVFPGFIDSHSHWYQPNRLGDYTPEEVDQILLSRGWTGTNDVNVEPHFADDLFSWHEEGRIRVRMNAYLSINTPGSDRDRYGDWFSERGIAPGSTIGERLRIAGIKVFIASDWDRFVKWDQDELNREIANYHDQGWQIAAKQISDESLDMALAAFGSLPDGVGDRRHRLEHALEMRADQIPMVAGLGLLPIVQLGGIESDLQHEEGFDELVSDDGIDRIWPFQEMAGAGQPLVGSMAVVPLEGLRGPFTISVMQMLHGALRGVSEVGNEPWPGRQSQLMNIDQALASITSLAAWSTFEEESRGTLTAGKLADFVVLSRDLRLGGDDPEMLKTVTVDATFIDGRLEWCGFGLDVWCAGFGQPIPERLLFHETLAPLEPGQSNPEATTETPQPVGGGPVATVTASQGASTAVNAVDGNEETVWSSGGGPPQWIELDLGEPVEVASLRLLVDQYPPGRTVHQVYGGAHSDPGQLLAEIDGETEWGQLLEVEIGQTVRFLRILTVESPSWVSWFEVEVVLQP